MLSYQDWEMTRLQASPELRINGTRRRITNTDLVFRASFRLVDSVRRELERVRGQFHRVRDAFAIICHGR